MNRCHRPNPFRSLRFSLLALSWALAVSAPGTASSATFVVNSQADSSDLFLQGGTCDTGILITGENGLLEPECTLRAAIEQANFSSAADVIRFSNALNIVGSTVVITPSTELPAITQPVEIRGDLAPTYDGSDPNENPVITLSGSSLSGAGEGGLTFSGVTGASVDALSIIGFPGSGIVIENSVGTRVGGCHIGVWRGFFVLGNGGDGIFEDSSSSDSILGFHETVSGSFEGVPNVIAASGGDGIHSEGARVKIVGNRIGTDRSGTTLQPLFGGFHGNGGWGVWIGGADAGVGGGAPTAAPEFVGNVIAGNALGGLYQDASASDTEILANRIGTNIQGTAALGNGVSGRGIFLTGDGAEVGRETLAGETGLAANVISGNGGTGILVLGASGSISIQHNRIGVSLDGDIGLGNGADGIFVWSNVPAVDIAFNWIGDNQGRGIYVWNDGSQIWANWIGTTPSDAVLGNGSSGIEAYGANTAIGASVTALPTELNARGNTIRFNQGDGILALNPGSGGLTFRGNRISQNFDRGIEIGPGGPEINDVWDFDSGTNRLQNNPDIDPALSNWNAATGDVQIGYSVQGLSGFTTFPLVVDFYATRPGDIQPFAHFATDIYPELIPAAQTKQFIVTPDPALGITAGTRIVGIATDQMGNSSEQSFNRTLPEPNPILAIASGCMALAFARRPFRRMDSKEGRSVPNVSP